LKPGNDYAVSKLSMEHMAALWQPLLPITVVRPFNYTGAGQASDFLIPKIVEHFRGHQQTIRLGNVEVSRDFSDVRTVAWFYSQLALKAYPGEVFNLSSGSTHSI
jgi:nucleoside-diphosphate-sugar epimerase